MAKAPTLTTITAGQYDSVTITANFDAIVTAFDNTVSRDGSAPNAMAGNLDMNSYDIINVGTMDVASLTVNSVDITDVVSNPLNGLSPVNGDILYYNAGAWNLLNIGSDGQVLKVSSSLPAWGTDTDTDTVGVTVEEDAVSVQTNVTIINFVTGVQATGPIVSSPGAGQVDVDLDLLVNPV